jgi:hypothetical protein
VRREDLAAMAQRVPALGTVTDAIASLRATADALPIEPFWEPVTLVLDEEEETGRRKKRLLAVRASDLRAWSRHMAYSVRVRLRSTESAVVHNIAEGSLLPAAILLRSHLESAALGVYCLDTVTDCAASGSMEQLAELIHKTLFGTAVVKHVATKEWIAQLVSGAETNTIRICRAIEALDRYVHQGKPSGDIGIAYSVLCEFAHPNHRGVMTFKTSQPEGEGWTIRYGLDEPFDAELATRLVNCLAVSMQGGLFRLRDAARLGLQGRPWRDRVGLAVSRDDATCLDHVDPASCLKNAGQQTVSPDAGPRSLRSLGPPQVNGSVMRTVTGRKPERLRARDLAER